MHKEQNRDLRVMIMEAMSTIDALTKDVGGSARMLPVAVICTDPGSRMLERLCRIGARIAGGPDGSIVAVLPHSRQFLFSAEVPSEGVRALVARAAGKQLVLAQSGAAILRLQIPPCPWERQVFFSDSDSSARVAA